MRIGYPRDNAEQLAVLCCLFAEDPCAADRANEALRLAAANEIALGGLVGAWKNDKVCAASLFCKLADGSAFVWPPVVFNASENYSDGVAAEVLAELVSLASREGCRFLQTAIEPIRTLQCRAFEAAGFDHLADLQYRHHPLEKPSARAFDQPIASITYDDAKRDRFGAVIEQSYRDSMDCSKFSGVRSAADALVSYRHAGDFTPERWRLVERDGQDIAVILVNDHSEDRCREIIYLGVIPDGRRRGIARRLVEEVITEAYEAGCKSVLVAVDAVNEPANRLYAELGFEPRFVRAVYLWRPNSTAAP